MLLMYEYSWIPDNRWDGTVLIAYPTGPVQGSARTYNQPRQFVVQQRAGKVMALLHQDCSTGLNKRHRFRVDSINIAGDVDDVPLPPIPFDIFDKANADCDFGEVALFVETPDVNDVSLCNHGKFIGRTPHAIPFT